MPDTPKEFDDSFDDIAARMNIYDVIELPEC